MFHPCQEADSPHFWPKQIAKIADVSPKIQFAQQYVTKFALSDINIVNWLLTPPFTAHNVRPSIKEPLGMTSVVVILGKQRMGR